MSFGFFKNGKADLTELTFALTNSNERSCCIASHTCRLSVGIFLLYENCKIFSLWL